jgi:sortase B
MSEDSDWSESNDPIEDNDPIEYNGLYEINDLSENSRRNRKSASRKKVLYISLMILGIILTTAALRVILNDVREDTVARVEYSQIRERFPEISGQVNDDSDNTIRNDNDEDTDLEEEEEEAARELRELSLDELAAINRDFVGWINALHSIDYPVVQGRDNDKYINITFYGSRNSAGTIFMDYRHTRGFDENVVILYGHRTRDGSMFSALESYLNSDFLRRNPNIDITKRDGSRVTYTVFAAKVTDAWDAAYTVGISETARASEVFPNAPQNASHFLLLSTCTRGNDDNERLLVFAALT